MKKADTKRTLTLQKSVVRPLDRNQLAGIVGGRWEEKQADDVMSIPIPDDRG